MFKSIVCLVLVCGLAGMSAAAATPKVKISKVTLAKRQSQARDLPRGSSQMEEKQVGIRFELQQSGAAPGSSLRFEWTALVEAPSGRLEPGADGVQPVVFSNALPVVIESAPVMLQERTWRGTKRAGSIESSIAGVAWRAWDMQGNLLGEGYDPPSIKAQVDWNRAGGSAPDPEEAPERRPKRRPGLPGDL